MAGGEDFVGAMLGRASLRYYAPNLRQPVHDHESAHVSVLLAGAFEERCGSGAASVTGNSLRLRPSGFHHATHFSPVGALILTFPCADPNGAEWCAPWRPPAQPGAFRAALRRLLTAEGEFESAEAEVLAAYAPPIEARRPAPVWLVAARDRLTEEPHTCIAQLARDASVHRVYFARAFRAAFGIAPSVYRRKMMMERSLASLFAHSAPMVEASASGGFADQSHMCRAFVEFLGLSPSRLHRRLG